MPSTEILSPVPKHSQAPNVLSVQNWNASSEGRGTPKANPFSPDGSETLEEIPLTPSDLTPVNRQVTDDMSDVTLSNENAPTAVAEIALKVPVSKVRPARDTTFHRAATPRSYPSKVRAVRQTRRLSRGTILSQSGNDVLVSNKDNGGNVASGHDSGSNSGHLHQPKIQAAQVQHSSDLFVKKYRRDHERLYKSDSIPVPKVRPFYTPEQFSQKYRQDHESQSNSIPVSKVQVIKAQHSSELFSQKYRPEQERLYEADSIPAKVQAIHQDSPDPKRQFKTVSKVGPWLADYQNEDDLSTPRALSGPLVDAKRRASLAPSNGSNRAEPEPSIPTSKLRPYFQEPPSVAYQRDHHHQNKVRPFEESAGHDADDEAYFDVGSDVSLKDRPKHLAARQRHSPRSDGSIAGALDYKRTVQWLRELLNYPEEHQTKFTEKPKDLGSTPGSRTDEFRSVQSFLSSQVSDREGVDGSVFRKTVGDMESLLGDALAVAAQVAEPRRETSRSSSERLELSPRRLELSPKTQESCPERQESLGSESIGKLIMSPINTDDGTPHNGVKPFRPAPRHALTSPGPHSERPRLNDVVPSFLTVPQLPLMADSEDTSTRDFVPTVRRISLIRSLRQKRLHVPAQMLRKHSLQLAGQSLRRRFTHVPTRKSSLESLNQAKGHGHEQVQLSDPSVCCDCGKVYDADVIDFETQYQTQHQGHQPPRRQYKDGQQSRPLAIELHAMPGTPEQAPRPLPESHGINLRGKSHVSLRGDNGFSLDKAHRSRPLPRDWSPMRKKTVAAVACASTALIGIILGIYAGMTPSIQYYIIDEQHATVMGNVGCFAGLAIPTFFFWPLPLLHGRKPYIMGGLSVAMPLLFPQAVAVHTQRLTSIAAWRAAVMVPRAVMGVALGFASMNFHAILLDIFGASLMSSCPHEEAVDSYDVRRHGGGMGVWLGIWTWCWIGSLAFGFLIGAVIIDSLPPVWGFYLSIVLIATVLLMNVVCPETRRSPWRKSVTEVIDGTTVSRRVARGEVMMHRVQDGPRWWGQEVWHGVMLSLEMLRQPGFAVMAVYCGWIYAQVVLIMILLGSLASRHYRLRSPWVGLLVGTVALGALIAVPFQKANLFSRSRRGAADTNTMTLNTKVSWSSHLVRRGIFTLILPLMGMAYAVSSTGPPTNIALPTLFALAIGFLSCLAVSEVNGLLMETFDCSDLQPGMTGKPRPSAGTTPKRTNYSSFPRVSAALAISHTLAFVLAAAATVLGGSMRRVWGQRTATGVVAGILLVLTTLLLLVLVRFRQVDVVPRSRTFEMEKWIAARRASVRRASAPEPSSSSSAIRTRLPPVVLEETPEEVDAWRPIMIGNPVGRARRVNVLELGALSRWTEIRRKNRLLDNGEHLNRQALDLAAGALDAQASEIGSGALETCRRVSQRSGEVLRRVRGSGEGSGGGIGERGWRRVGRSTGSGEEGGEGEHGGHGHAGGYVERDCFMGQSVVEDEEPEGGRRDGELVGRSRSRRRFGR